MGKITLDAIASRDRPSKPGLLQQIMDVIVVTLMAELDANDELFDSS